MEEEVTKTVAIVSVSIVDPSTSTTKSRGAAQDYPALSLQFKTTPTADQRASVARHTESLAASDVSLRYRSQLRRLRYRRLETSTAAFACHSSRYPPRPDDLFHQLSSFPLSPE